MKKLIIFTFFILNILSFSKTVNLKFHFDIDSGVIFYSNADIDSLGTITTINFDSKDVNISLKDGVYIFGFYDNKDRYLFKKLYVTNNRDFKITFIPQKTIHISGSIKDNNNISMNNVKINFIDSVGREFPVFTDTNGNYSIDLPPEKYKVLSSQFGYEIINEKTDFDFSVPNNSYTLPFIFKKSIGNIEGKILNDLGYPIPNAKIIVSNNKKDKIIYSDKNGDFSIDLKEGITTLQISRDGYYSKAFIDNFTRKDTTIFHRFVLNKKTYFISGAVVNDVLPVKNQEIYLFSKNGILLDKQITNENGNFKFLNITNEDLFVYIPENEIYEEYKSSYFKIDKSLENNIILLNKKLSE